MTVHADLIFSGGPVHLGNAGPQPGHGGRRHG